MRFIALLPTAVALFLLLAPVALAADSSQEPLSGEGLYGAADDKVVTNFFFVVIFVVPIFVLTMSLIMIRLEKRKDARKAAAKRIKSEWGDAGW